MLVNFMNDPLDVWTTCASFNAMLSFIFAHQIKSHVKIKTNKHDRGRSMVEAEGKEEIASSGAAKFKKLLCCCIFTLFRFKRYIFGITKDLKTFWYGLCICMLRLLLGLLPCLESVVLFIKTKDAFIFPGFLWIDSFCDWWDNRNLAATIDAAWNCFRADAQRRWTSKLAPWIFRQWHAEIDTVSTRWEKEPACWHSEKKGQRVDTLARKKKEKIAQNPARPKNLL